MTDAELIAFITGSFLVLAAAITGTFTWLSARLNRGGKRYEALQLVVDELVRQNTEHEEEMATLREQVAVFQVYVDAVDEVFTMAPDEATVGSIRPKLPLKPSAVRVKPRRGAGGGKSTSAARDDWRPA